MAADMPPPSVPIVLHGPPTEPIEHPLRGLERFALAGIGVGIAVLAIKIVAFLISGSVALYSDALESTINVVASTAAYVAVRLAAKPPDENYPYGYGKAEYLSAIFEGALIAVAAFAIMREAYATFLAPHAIATPLLGMAVNALATALNVGWSIALHRAGKRWRSPALLADAKHLQTDVMTSIGVVFGVGLVAWTGIPWLDPAIAILVGINTLWSGTMLVRDSLAGLLDAAAPSDVLAAIEALLEREAYGAMQIHDLRTRVAGERLFVEFHLVVDGTTSVSRSHAICDRLENVVETAFPNARVTVHVEPHDLALPPEL
jgi:cation diffusion facilitator family transporter